MATSGVMQSGAAVPAILAPSAEGNGRSRWVLGNMHGRSAAMERLFLQMRYLAGHLRVATLEGERGAGKRLAAETLHQIGPVSGQSFVAAEAAAFLGDPGMAERLEAAAGGTLYLAGVDTLDAEGQLRLLHLLDWVRGTAAGQRGRVALAADPALLERLAPPRTLLVSARRPLRALALYGRFRVDLQQQLSLVKLALPPLRERREDVKLLAELFAAEAARAAARSCPPFSREALLALEAQPWQANVAELREVVRVAVARAADRILPTDLGLGAIAPVPAAHDMPVRYAMLHRGGPQQPASVRSEEEEAVLRRAGAGLVEQFPPSVSAPSRGGLTVVPPVEDLNLDRAILRHIRAALARVHGNKLQAARLLGISRSTLYRLLEGGAAKAVPPA